MKIKTSELEGAALDWAVATIESRDIVIHSVGQYRYDKPGGIHCCKYGCTFGPRNIQHGVEGYSPSEEWTQGGPLIEKTKVAIVNATDRSPWLAMCMATKWMEGPTPLIAAMRAIISSELGDEVDVPEELIQ